MLQTTPDIPIIYFKWGFNEVLLNVLNIENAQKKFFGFKYELYIYF